MRLAISIAARAASDPLFPALVPDRSIACSIVSQVSTPKIHGTEVSIPAIASARDLLSGALGDTDRCNEYLKRHCRHWGLERLALVDRGILRLGVHELLTQQAPPKVVIAESLKLAREFSTAESPRFINGVLDSVVKELTSDEASPAEPPEAGN